MRFWSMELADAGRVSLWLNHVPILSILGILGILGSSHAFPGVASATGS